MKKKNQKNKMKKSKNGKKQRQPKNREKRGAKVEQYLEEHIDSVIWVVFVCADFRLVPNHIPIIASLDTSDTWNVNRPATKTSTRDTYSASLGSEKIKWLSIVEQYLEWTQDPLFALFLIIFLLFASLDTSDTWNVNRPATKLIFSVVTSFVLLQK